MIKQVGDFHLEAWTDGWPMWVHIRHGNAELKFSSDELPDLEHIVNCVKRLEAERDARTMAAR